MTRWTMSELATHYYFNELTATKSSLTEKEMEEQIKAIHNFVGYLEGRKIRNVLDFDSKYSIITACSQHSILL